MEHTDNELSYERPRTIPPIQSLTNGAPSSPPPPPEEEDWRGMSEKEREKEAEARAELEEELRIMVRAWKRDGLLQETITNHL